MLNIEEQVINIKNTISNKYRTCELELVFEFEDEENCRAYYKKLYHPNDIDFLIEPYIKDGKYVCGIKNFMSQDVKHITDTVKFQGNRVKEFNGYLVVCNVNET